MTIYINNPTPGTKYTHTLTASLTDSVVLDAKVSLSLNGYNINGAGNSLNSIGVLSNSSGAEVIGPGEITGFGAGIHLSGGNGAVANVVVHQCLVRGIGVAGGTQSVYGCTVGNIGSPTYPFYGAASGIVTWDENNYLADNNVYGIKGKYESVSYSVGNGGTMLRCLAQGQNSTGWSFAVWSSSSNEVNIEDCEFYSYDTGLGIGGTGEVKIKDTVISSNWKTALADFTDLGGNTITVASPDNSSTVYGTTLRDTVVGGASSNVLVGLGGADTMIGGEGADIFVFSPGNVLSTAPDFEQGVDKIYMAYTTANTLQYGTTATGTNPVVLWDANQHRILYAPNGSAGAVEEVAYLPYVDELTSADFYGW